MKTCKLSAPLFLVVVILVATFEQARASDNERQLAWKRLREGQRWRNEWEIQRREARKLNFYGAPKDFKVDEIPPTDQPALVARFIVNQAEWSSVATISSRKDIASAPFASLVDISDGPLGKGSGVPYMFLTPLDSTAQDVALDPRASMIMSLAQGSYCDNKGYDAMDPRCARTILTGKIVEIKVDSGEYPVAKAAVFGRHPWLVNMPPNHHFFFAKLEVETIVVLDYFGGPKYVTPEDYLHPPMSGNL